MDNQKLSARLSALAEKATKGPWRAHDHNGMARVGGDPAEWVGYAWVGRIMPESGPNGEFDAGFLQTDRRKDGLQSYRENAEFDVALVTALLNALPTIISALQEKDL